MRTSRKSCSALTWLGPLLVAVLAGCGGADGGTDGNGGQCEERWVVYARGEAVAEVAEGELRLRAPIVDAGATLAVGQRGLTGDFAITVRFDDMATAGDDTYIAVYVYSQPSYAGVDFVDRTGRDLGLRAHVDNRQADEATTIGDEYRSGTVQMDRVGSVISVQGNDGLGGVTNEGPYPAGTAEFWIALGSFSSEVTQVPVVVSFDEILVSQAGDLGRSDSFDCDSLAPAQSF